MPESLIKLQASGLGLRTLLFTEDLWWLILKFIKILFFNKKKKKKKKKKSAGHNYFTIHVNKKSAERVTRF